MPLIEAMDDHVRAGNRMTDELDEEATRRTAYFLWEQDGRPVGREEFYWQRAQEMHRRQRNFDRMLGDNLPADDEKGE
jgi:hypothetical protein